MKRYARSALGVTLLEIMLVLAIAALIIVMSVRYYKTASSTQQMNTFLANVQGIAAAADNLMQTTGEYPTSASALQVLLPTGVLILPWGGTMTYTSTSASQYTVSFSSAAPTAICPLLTEKLEANDHYTMTGGCTGYTYKANP